MRLVLYNHIMILSYMTLGTGDGRVQQVCSNWHEAGFDFTVVWGYYVLDAVAEIVR